MPFWKKTKKLLSNFKRQGSDRIKIPSTQEICRSQSDYAIDSLKLYEKQLELLKKNNEENKMSTIKQRPLSLFIERNDGFDDESVSNNSTVENKSINSNSEISSNCSSNQSLDKNKLNNTEVLMPQLQIRVSSKVRWTDFSVSDLHNFLMILQKEEDTTKTAIINRYRYLSKQINLRLKLMKT